jgi:hypothetical protein
MLSSRKHSSFLQNEFTKKNILYDWSLVKKTVAKSDCNISSHFEEEEQEDIIKGATTFSITTFGIMTQHDNIKNTTLGISYT